MNHIGDIIKAYRDKQNFSRKELSGGICTEKFLYLIEKNERTPSAEVLRLLGNRLGMDFFEYFQYLDCQNPIKVREFLLQCDQLRRTGDFLKLDQLNEKMKELLDFAQKPWEYEIYVNQYLIQLHKGSDRQSIVKGVEELLRHLEPKYADEEFTAKLYIVLSIAYQALHDMENAERTLTAAEEIISNEKENARYNQIYITTKLTHMAWFQHTGDYKSAIEEGLKILRFQEETNAHERLNITYHFLASAYYLDGQQEIGVKWFEKAVLNLLTLYRPSRASLMYTSELYPTISSDPRVKKELLAMLKEVYDFIQ